MLSDCDGGVGAQSRRATADLRRCIGHRSYDRPCIAQPGLQMAERNPRRNGDKELAITDGRQ